MEINGINNISSVNTTKIKEQKNINFGKSLLNSAEEKDSIKISSQQETNKPISFKEGVKLFAEGFKSKIKGIATNIVKHPFKTAAILVGTTALMSALPLIGISTVAAGSALVLGYAGVAVGKTVYHTAKFINNNKNEKYDEARENLKSMGGDTVDLALTLPFVPKAIQNTKNFLKFGRIGINHELINEIKTSQGISNKLKALKAGNIKITEDVNFRAEASKFCKTPEQMAEFEALRKLPPEEFTQQVYKKIAEDMGVGDIAPEMKLDPNMQKNVLGGFNNGECSIQFNSEAFKNMKQSEIINTIRHELEHYKQYSDIARYKGADYLYELQVRSYLERMKNGETSPFDFGLSANKKYIETHGEEQFVEEMIQKLKNKNTVNVEAYQAAIDKFGPIEAGSEEAIMAEKYIEASMKYPDLTFTFFGPPTKYTENILEVKAREAGANPSGEMGAYKKTVETAGKVNDTYIHDIIISSGQGDIVTD